MFSKKSAAAAAAIFLSPFMHKETKSEKSVPYYRIDY